MNFLHSLFTYALLFTPLVGIASGGLTPEEAFFSGGLGRCGESSIATVGLCSNMASNVVLSTARLELPNTNIDNGEAICIPLRGYELDSLTAFTFEFDYDPAKLSMDSLINIHPLLTGVMLNPANGRMFFSEANGMEVTILDGDVLFELCITGQAAGPASDTIRFGESPQPQFNSLSTSFPVELNSAIIRINGGVSSLQSQIKESISCSWQTNDRLIVSHPASLRSAIIDLYTLDGRRLREEVIKPRTSTTKIPVSQFWQHTFLIVRYSQNGHSHSRLIAGPR